jgi:hypothetical protein
MKDNKAKSVISPNHNSVTNEAATSGLQGLM